MAAANTFDAIVIGAGANGLVAAATLGKAGKRVLVVDGAPSIGGQSRAIEFAPGFRAAPFAVDAGWLPPTVARGIGLSAIPAVDPAHSVTVANGDGGFLALPRDHARAADAIRKYSERDAKAWPGFANGLRALSGFLEAMYQLPAPDIDTTAVGEIVPLLGLGRKFRSLGRAHMTDLLRVLPMPVQDLLDDALENATLKAAIGAGAVRDIRQGPRSGGTALVLLHYLAGAPSGSVRARSWWQSGPDAFDAAVQAIALQHGVTIRANAPVARIVVRDDAVTGVALENGDEISAPVVVSTADPVRTLLGLVDPLWLDPEFMHAVRNIKLRGCTAVVQYALDKLPDIPGLDGIVSLTPHLDGLERAYDAAKYGGASETPHIELTSPSLRWSSVAPAGKHVLIARVQYVANRRGTWDAGLGTDGRGTWDVGLGHEGRGTGDLGLGTRLEESVTRAIAAVSPRFAGTVLHRSVLTPADISREFGVTDGAVTHGELMLDQVLFMRPVAGWARYAMPIAGLYLGGSGAHPGPGILGGAGLMAARAALGMTHARLRR